MHSHTARLAKRNKKVSGSAVVAAPSVAAAADAPVIQTATATARHDELMQERSAEIAIRGLTLAFEDVTLISNGYLHLVPNHRYAIHAENGAGKSTLLRAIVDGKIAGWPTCLTTQMVNQDLRGDDRTAIDILLASDVRASELRARVAELEKKPDLTASVGDEFAAVVDELTDVESNAKEQLARAEQLLRSVGFTKKLLQQPSSQLSGGWLMRVAIAVALFSNPDLLLLDEPTNHLDLSGIRWLERFLASSTAGMTVLFVSHDREFVDHVATDVILLAGRALTYFPGNFAAFEKSRADLMEQARSKAAVDAKRKSQLEAQLVRARSQQQHQRDGNSGAVQAIKTKLERVGQLTNTRDFDASWRTVRRELWTWGSSDAANVSWSADASRLQDANNLRVAFDVPAPLGVQRSLLTLDNVSFSYGAGEPTLFSGVNMAVELDSRIAIVGDNGKGKSTLLRILAGQLQPTKGTRSAVHAANIAYFGQHQVDLYDARMTPLAEMMRQFPGTNEQELRGALGSMGLGGKLATQLIGTLSGGQKCRLALAALAFSKPHIMLLDEPTRHLSYTSIEALIDGLDAFKGALVVVTHDRYFISQLRVTEVWRAADSTFKRSVGDDEW